MNYWAGKKIRLRAVKLQHIKKIEFHDEITYGITKEEYNNLYK